MLKTIYHIDNGPQEMYEIDAREAVQKFPKEWSDQPWMAPKKSNTKVSEPKTVTYSSKDNGDGTFSIVDDAGAAVVASVTADEVKEFDGMSDTDKAAFVKAKTASS